jgi:hypothetical protein
MALERKLTRILGSHPVFWGFVDDVEPTTRPSEDLGNSHKLHVGGIHLLLCI